MIKDRLEALRKEMMLRGIDYYYVPTCDYHNTENVADFFKSRQYLSGFTGSEGDLLVGLNEAWLWVDGRYFIQSKIELEGSLINRMEIGEPNVPSLIEVLSKKLKKGGKIGFDGRVVSYSFVERLKTELSLGEDRIRGEEDLVDKIWKDRPFLSREKTILINEESLEKRKNKIEKVQKFLEEKDIDLMIFSQLDDINWLLNMRGRDVSFFPVVYCFLVIYRNKTVLFIDAEKIEDIQLDELKEDNIEVLSYFYFYDYLKDIKERRVFLDKDVSSYSILKSLGKKEVAYGELPTTVWKSVKNNKEILETKKAHIKDGVAMTKFLYWLDKYEDKKELTELDVSKKVDEFRSKEEGFIESSFSTISAYKENGAIVHYIPKEDSRSLDNEGFLLLDSGGQYIDGTTDVTRTISIGELSEEEKVHYTAVLRAMIRLSKAKFLEGCNGMNLDILARGVIWEMGIDYKHGTGHGVGHKLNVHEGPIGFRWKKIEGVNDMEVLREGMILSNEPGIYIENSHGIRIENELLIVNCEQNSFGKFLKFEELTLVPIDTKPLIIKNMEKSEIDWLNNYHKRVYTKLEKFLTIEEKLWLKEATKPLNYLS